MMKRIHLVLPWALACAISPLRAQTALTRQRPPLKNSVATLIDHRQGGVVEVVRGAAIEFPRDAFYSDVSVLAQVDAAAGYLLVRTRGGELRSAETRLRVDLSRFPKGLQLVLEHTVDRSGAAYAMVTALDRDRNILTVEADNELQCFRIDRSTIVVMTENNQRQRQEQWTSLGYGDKVRIRYGAGRRADTIEATRRSGEGVVHHVAGNRVALIGAAKPLELQPGARVQDAGGKVLQLTSLHLNDRIQYRLHPDTGRVVMLIRTEAAPSGNLLAVTHDAGAPLYPGDRVRLRAMGTRGGMVTFDIVGVENDLRASELRNQPGTYELLYTVPRGVKTPQAKLVARLRLPTGRSDMLSASQPIRFVVSGAAPAAKPPSAPRILQPKDGAELGDSFVVQGVTDRGNKVRITIDYKVTKSIFTLAEGKLKEIEVKADDKGVFTSGEISTDVRTLIRGDTSFTITVIAIDSAGRESAPTVVKARK